MIYQGDALTVLRTLPDESVDAVITDPPYGIGFMGLGWDRGVPPVAVWAEARRIAKPGANLLAFGGSRMSHRLACAIEDAGWEIQDTIAWIYGHGIDINPEFVSIAERRIAAVAPLGGGPSPRP